MWKSKWTLEVFKVNQGKGESVIGLSFTHPSPKFGAEVIDLLIARFDDTHANAIRPRLSNRLSTWKVSFARLV